jgi:hypothetical protein
MKDVILMNITITIIRSLSLSNINIICTPFYYAQQSNILFAFAFTGLNQLADRVEHAELRYFVDSTHSHFGSV